MKGLMRVTPEEAYSKVASGKAALVCAYNDDERYSQMRLEGAISLSEFDSNPSKYPKDREIIFYCA